MDIFTPAVLNNATLKAFENLPEDPRAKAAFALFMDLTLADRTQATRHVMAYYSDIRQEVGADEVDQDMRSPASPENIWNHVQPHGVSMMSDDAHWYVIVECNCDWDAEHGVTLSFRHGTDIAKVGGFDGHPTNVFAYDDDTLEGVIYRSAWGNHTRETD